MIQGNSNSEFIESESYGLKRIDLKAIHAYVEFSIQDESNATINKFNTSEPRKGNGTKLIQELLKRYSNYKWIVLSANIRSGSFFAKWNQEHGDTFFNIGKNKEIISIDNDYVAEQLPLDETE